MEGSSRIIKSQYNLIFSLINNIVITILGFATRTVFVHSLGVDYLGLNGLFTNVLSLLSLAELGIGSAITFSLYKPIAENDQKKIKALMRLYKKAYQKIGWIILMLGIAITPFLRYMVNLDAEIDVNYYIIYYLFLGNTVISYWFFAYRSVIIYANQEGYILTKVETIFALIKAVLQFGILFTLRNYYMYLLIPIIVGIIKNIIISDIAGKKYPIINECTEEKLPESERKEIFKNVYALTMFKVSSVVYSSTDNIIISTWLGTKIVGLVSNYTMIIQLVATYVNMFFQSMYASVGNLNATESKEYKFIIFNRLQLLNFWIYSYCTICLGSFLNPCIKIWLGNEYCLNESTVILMALVFFVPGMNNVINIYKDACGLFKEVQYRALATAIVNLIVSIVLVAFIGVDGVFIGTIVAYLTTIYQVDPRVVFKNIFKQPVSIFYKDLFKKIMLFLCVFGAINYLIKMFEINSWIMLIGFFLIISFITNFVLWGLYRKTEEFKYLTEVAKGITRKIIRRK